LHGRVRKRESRGAANRQKFDHFAKLSNFLSSIDENRISTINFTHRDRRIRKHLRREFF